MEIDMPIPPQVNMTIITPSKTKYGGHTWLIEDVIYDVKSKIITAWLGTWDLDKEEEEMPGFMDSGETLSHFMREYYEDGWEDLPEGAPVF